MYPPIRCGTSSEHQGCRETMLTAIILSVGSDASITSAEVPNPSLNDPSLTAMATPSQMACATCIPLSVESKRPTAHQLLGGRAAIASASIEGGVSGAGGHPDQILTGRTHWVGVGRQWRVEEE
jgi:hypothetical protein